MPQRRLKLLFFAEGVTLAHVARPVALARLLDPARYDIVLACAPRYAGFATDARWRRVDLDSVAPQQFNDALARGAPVYSAATLENYVEQDLALIAAERPDLVVGDFRLSLSVSARLARVPYLAIANAYWTPEAPPHYPLPVLPLSRALPLPLARALFAVGRPLAFYQHCGPMNRLRARHGLPGFGNDLRRAYSDSDHLLLPDIAALYPLAREAPAASWIGPLAWSPEVTPPPWWDEPVPDDVATVYLTLGSSGPPAALACVLEALADLPVRVLASSAGGPAPDVLPANARLAPYLPGDAAAARSRLVVCNGGSLTVQQALACGVPVLGLASNMDQFLNMAPVVHAGAGLVLRTDRLDPAGIRRACQALLAQAAHATAAEQLQRMMLDQPGAAIVFDRAAARLLGR